MNTPKKITLAGLGALSLLALTACQSVQPQENRAKANKQGMDRAHHAERHHHMSRHHHKGSYRHVGLNKQYQQAVQTACQNKSTGEEVTFQINQRQMTGQCQVIFQPTKVEQLKQLKIANTATVDKTEQTAAQRNEFRQQQRAARIAQREAFNKTCEGQKPGQNIQAKIGEQLIDGQCQVAFFTKKATKVAATS